MHFMLQVAKWNNNNTAENRKWKLWTCETWCSVVHSGFLILTSVDTKIGLFQIITLQSLLDKNPWGLFSKINKIVLLSKFKREIVNKVEGRCTQHIFRGLRQCYLLADINTLILIASLALYHWHFIKTILHFRKVKFT